MFGVKPKHISRFKLAGKHYLHIVYQWPNSYGGVYWFRTIGPFSFDYQAEIKRAEILRGDLVRLGRTVIKLESEGIIKGGRKK